MCIRTLVLAAALSPAVLGSGEQCVSIVEYGAKGDGATDSTKAFRAAVQAVSNVSGCVWIPPAAGGYVLTSTVTVPPGVALIGQPAGMTTGSKNLGAVILARPAAMNEPLFSITKGVTLRGVHIEYDQMPFPSDADFQNKTSKFYYQTFADARAHFYDDHIPAVGPTIYATHGTRFVIEDVTASGFRDFLYCKTCGMSHIRRVHGFGYGTFITIELAMDVMSLTELHYTVNAGPHFVGNGYSWAPGIIASSPNNVALWMGRADGFILREAFFFGINTGIRYGYATSSYPLIDPSTNEPAVLLEQAHGPWGAVTDLMIDQCQVGLHFVWPNPLFNRLSNVQVHPSFVDNRQFAVGSNESIGLEAAVVVEETHSRANNKNMAAVMHFNSLAIASFADTPRFGPAAATVNDSNGRIFLIAGAAMIETDLFVCDNIQEASSHILATGPKADYSMRMRGVILNNGISDDLVFHS